MYKRIKHLMALFTAIMILLAPFATNALAADSLDVDKSETSAGAMFYDLFFLRPFGAAATVGGSVIFVLGLPFSAIGGNVGKSGEKLVADPFKYTLDRPLGNF